MANSATPSTIVQKSSVTIGAPSVTTQTQISNAASATAYDTAVAAAKAAAAAAGVEYDITKPLLLTKFQFRQLFTLNERIAVDNVQYNTALSGSVRAAVVTFQKDMDVSGEVNLHLPLVITGVTFLVSIGILTSARAARILANLPAV